MYVNATQVSQLTASYQLPNQPTSTWFIGNSGFGEPFDGGIDEVRIYNHGISSAQVKTDCETQIGAPPAAAPTGLSIGSVGVRIGDKELKVGF